MKQISVLLIDDHKDYSHLIENELKRRGISVNNRITHRKFIQSSIFTLPDIILISFRSTLTKALKTLAIVREKYSSVKIIGYACVYDKSFIDGILKTKIDGLVFNVENKPEELIEALITVFNGGKNLNL